MEIKNQTQETKNLKKLEEAELKVVLFDADDVIATSGDNGCDIGVSCLSAGTMITMADGSVKKIEDICVGDSVMTFDHETGCYIGSPVLLAYRSDAPKCAFTLRFDNGAALSVVGEHDLFEQESMKYVTICEDNAEQFVGRHFYSAADSAYTELTGVIRETSATDYYEIYSAKTLNMVANGMLNVADDVDYLLNIYEFDADLCANREALEDDIRKYGLFAFSEKLGYTEQEYYGWNMRCLNIAVGKGLISWDELRHQSVEYLNPGNGSFRCA